MYRNLSNDYSIFYRYNNSKWKIRVMKILRTICSVHLWYSQTDTAQFTREHFANVVVSYFEDGTTTKVLQCFCPFESDQISGEFFTLQLTCTKFVVGLQSKDDWVMNGALKWIFHAVRLIITVIGNMWLKLITLFKVMIT